MFLHQKWLVDRAQCMDKIHNLNRVQSFLYLLYIACNKRDRIRKKSTTVWFQTFRDIYDTNIRDHINSNAQLSQDEPKKKIITLHSHNFIAQHTHHPTGRTLFNAAPYANTPLSDYFVCTLKNWIRWVAQTRRLIALFIGYISNANGVRIANA